MNSIQNANTANHPAVLWLRDEFMPTAGSLRKAEKQLGISEKTLRALMNGTYEGDTKKQLLKLAEQMELHRARAAGVQSTRFIPTELMRRCHNAFDAAKAAHLMNFVIGVSQIGKTTSALAYKEKYPETTVLIRLSQKPTIFTVVRELADALRIPGKHNTTDTTMRLLRQALSPRHLIIVDEAHLALDRQQGADALDVVRELYDRTGCAVTLLFTDLDGSRFTRSPYAAQLEQLKRRGLQEVMPPEPSLPDVRAIWQAFNLPEPDQDTQKTIGALVRRSCFGELLARIRLALAEAKRGGSSLDWSFFNRALKRMNKTLA